MLFLQASNEKLNLTKDNNLYEVLYSTENKYFTFYLDIDSTNEEILNKYLSLDEKRE